MRLIKASKITTLNDFYNIMTPTREMSIKYVLNNNQNATNLNELITKALNVRNRQEYINVELSNNDLQELINKYIGKKVITSFQDVYKYISLQDIKNKLDPERQFKQLVSTSDDPELLMKQYFTKFVLPIINKNVPIKVELNSIDTELTNYLKSYLDKAIASIKKDKLTLDDIANLNAFQMIKKQVIRAITSKTRIDAYIKKEQIKKNEIDDIRPSFITNAYRPFIIEYFNKALQLTLNKPLQDKLLKYLSQDDEYIHSFYRTINEYILPDTRNKIKVLEEKKDKIGDETDINIGQLDINNREKPFVIINEELIIGRPGESHSNLIQRTNNTGKSSFKRKNIDIEAESLAFGHIVNKLAFIERRNTNISTDRIISILKRSSLFDKIYSVPTDKQVIRLARRKA